MQLAIKQHTICDNVSDYRSIPPLSTKWQRTLPLADNSMDNSITFNQAIIPAIKSVFANNQSIDPAMTIYMAFGKVAVIVATTLQWTIRGAHGTATNAALMWMIRLSSALNHFPTMTRAAKLPTHGGEWECVL